MKNRSFYVCAGAVGAILVFPNLVVAQIQFTDVTAAAGLTRNAETWGASWGDLDSDGRPDLFVGNHRRIPTLYKNNGDGSFSNVIEQVDSTRTFLDNTFADHHGASWADIDNDGDQDLYVATNACCSNQLMMNVGGILLDRASTFGLDDDGSGWGTAWIDYNLDGRLDSVLLKFDQSVIERQTSNGTFTRSATPFLTGCTRDNYAQFVDLDVDGDLEMICVKEGNFPQRAFEIDSSSFMDISDIMPVTPQVNDTAVADFDGDQRSDVFMTRGKMRPTEALLVDANRVEAWLDSGRDHEKGFTFESNGSLTVTVNTRFDNFAGLVFIGADEINPDNITFTLDSNNPSHQGISSDRNAAGMYIGYDTALQQWRVIWQPGNSLRGYVTVDTAAPASNVVATGLLTGDNPATSRLMKNGVSGFNVDNGAGFSTPVSCVSAGSGDFDNDMDVDLYLVCRGSVQNRSNRLYENQGNGHFTEVSNAGGATGIVGIGLESAAGAGENVVVADYDVDGFLDLFVTNGLGLQPLRDPGGPHQLFHNRGTGNHWIELDLVGASANRDGIGAKVFATASGTTQLREQNGGFHRWAQHHQRIHFGLAGNTQVDLRVEWPSGTIDNHTGISTDKLYRAIEGGTLEEVFGSQDPVSLSIEDISVAEAAGSATFNVTLSTPSTQTVSVDYTTSSDTSGSEIIFEDTFETDMAWITNPSGTDIATTGHWERANPEDTSSNGVQLQLGTPVSGSFDLVTGALAGTSVGTDDIDRGLTSIRSPDISVPSSGPITLAFDYYLAYLGNSSSADFLRVTIVGSTSSVVLQEQGSPTSRAGAWSSFSSDLSAFSGEVIHLLVEASDESNPSLVEAGVDNVKITTSGQTGVATAGIDYQSVSGTLEFQPGETVKTIDVPILADAQLEGPEDFNMILSDPINASIQDDTGVGTITD